MCIIINSMEKASIYFKLGHLKLVKATSSCLELIQKAGKSLSWELVHTVYQRNISAGTATLMLEHFVLVLFNFIIPTWAMNFLSMTSSHILGKYGQIILVGYK